MTEIVMLLILKEGHVETGPKDHFSFSNAWRHKKTLLADWIKADKVCSVRPFVVAPCFSSWKLKQLVCLRTCRTKGDGS